MTATKKIKSHQERKRKIMIKIFKRALKGSLFLALKNKF